MNQNYPRRGELYWTQLDPAIGAAMQKTRPCLVVTSNVVNQFRRTVVVVPLSNTSPKAPPLYIPVPSAGFKSQAVIDQIRAVDKERIGNWIGSVTPTELQRIEEAIRTVLDLE